MAQLQVTKSILAKLLAAENITVSHQNTKTAYFDLKSRTLVCPIWKDMDGDLYDLLMGHEVGHALETPEQGWHNAIHETNGKVDNKFKSFLNVIEDARIEKKVKRRFPGLSKSFASAYKGLFDRNFFGVKNIDVNKLNLIDRINLRFKLGAHIHVPFNDVERDFVTEVEAAETWEEVESLARRIYDYVKENEQDKLNTQTDFDDLKAEQEKQEQQESGDESDDGEEFEDYDDSQEDSAGYDDGDGDDDEDSSSSEEEGPQQDQENAIANDPEAENGEPESITDRMFRKRENELVNDSGVVHMFYLPEANLKEIIISNKKVMDPLEAFLRRETNNPYGTYGRNKISYDTVVKKCVDIFNKNNKKFISHILKEFDMRKKATSYARAHTARTGELDTNVLHKYKFSNDLFKKICVVPKGKNHGMILFVDLSGSMNYNLPNTIEQLLVLVSFCKMANIPFEVYGFADSMGGKLTYAQRVDRKCWNFDVENDYSLPETEFHLKHLIGTSLSVADYRRSFNTLAVVANEYPASYWNEPGAKKNTGHFDRNWKPSEFILNGTPFIETLLASREMIKNFRAAHDLDITNVIYLTDGEGSSQLRLPTNAKWHISQVIYFVDKSTKKKIRVEYSQQAAVTELVRDVTGCKHIGYFIGSNRDIRSELTAVSRRASRGENKYTTNDILQMNKSFKENNFFACSNAGYDKYFYSTTSSNSIQEDNMVITEGMTKAKMASAFKKSVMSKRSNRLLVSKFAEEIATAL